MEKYKGRKTCIKQRDTHGWSGALRKSRSKRRPSLITTFYLQSLFLKHFIIASVDA